MDSPDHDACETRYRDLLGRVHDLAARIQRIEREQRAIVEILGDFRDLVRLVTSQLRLIDRRVDQVAARSDMHGYGERGARHFRN